MPKILIVEDELALRDVYATRLQAEGYQVVLASNGEEALATAVSERPDIILLDVMMPKISGFDVLDIIRTTPEIANTRVIMLTALSEETDRERGEKLGVDRYLVKSQVILEDVVNAVADVLSSPSISSPQQTPKNTKASVDTQSTSPPSSASSTSPPITPNNAEEHSDKENSAKINSLDINNQPSEVPSTNTPPQAPAQ
jgi:DNA-binding response OmpR family regulator